MKVAVVGSRDCKKLTIEDIIDKLPNDATMIISGGALGVDSLAREAAIKLEIQLVELLPDYDQYGKYAPLRRNRDIVEHSDMVIAFWDYKSSGTRNTILECLKTNKPIKIHMIE